MTKLDDLLLSLIKVMIRCHDGQSIPQKITIQFKQELSKAPNINVYDACAAIISKKPDDDVFIKLIDQFRNVYPERAPFLDFIFHEIKFIKFLKDKKTPFEEKQFTDYQAQLRQLFIDFHGMLTCPKSQSYKVTYSKYDKNPEALIDLKGLIDNSWRVGIVTLCKSGTILIEEVFNKFKLPYAPDYIEAEAKSKIADNEEINKIVLSICQEHHNDLLVPELLRKNTQLMDSNKQMKETLEELQIELQRHHSKIDGLKTHLTDLEQKTTQYENELERKGSLINSSQQKITEYEQLLDGKKDLIASLQQKISHLSREVRQQIGNITQEVKTPAPPVAQSIHTAKNLFRFGMYSSHSFPESSLSNQDLNESLQSTNSDSDLDLC